MEDDFSYPELAFEFIEGIEEVNIKEFPLYIYGKIRNDLYGTLTKQQILDIIKLNFYSMFHTRISILKEFMPEVLLQRQITDDTIDQIYSQAENLVKDDPDPVKFVDSITRHEQLLINNTSLRRILQEHPDISKQIVYAYGM